MAQRKTAKNNHLEEAVALLINNQAQFVARLSDMDQRFARIEDQFQQITALLLRHEEILMNLPETIRQKIGFKRQQ